VKVVEMDIELTREQEERLGYLILEFMEELKIAIPEEDDFVKESYHYDIIEMINKYLQYLKREEIERVAEAV
jgi:hypothetical protein